MFTAAEGGPVHHRNFRRRHYLPAVVRARKATVKKREAKSSVATEPLRAPVSTDQKVATIPESLRFHDLRHTCAALLIANGQQMEEVKDYLGHSSIRVTSDRYGHLFPKARATMADALERSYANAPAAGPADFSRTDAEIVRLPERKRAAQ